MAGFFVWDFSTTVFSLGFSAGLFFRTDISTGYFPP